MSESLLIWGAGGHGKVVADLVRASGFELTGFIDRDPAKLGTVADRGGAEVVVAEQRLLDLLGSGESLPCGATGVAFGIGDNTARVAALRSLVDARVFVPALIHHDSTRSPSVVIGAGTVVFPRAVINANTTIHEAVIINSGAIVEHDCTVHKGAHVSPGAVLAGGVTVGPRSWIGAGAVVIPGVCIGADAIVGAGAVVIRDVPDGVTVVGNPARIISSTTA